MTKLQEYVFEQFKKMDILDTIHNYVVSAQYNLDHNNIDESKKELDLLADYIESFQDILTILPMLAEIEKEERGEGNKDKRVVEENSKINSSAIILQDLFKS